MAFAEFLAQCKNKELYIERAIISPVRIVQIESIFKKKKRISLMLLDFNLKNKKTNERRRRPTTKKFVIIYFLFFSSTSLY
jgi:hypothetical protein